jgi:hypothetical protein
VADFAAVEAAERTLAAGRTAHTATRTAKRAVIATARNFDTQLLAWKAHLLFEGEPDTHRHRGETDEATGAKTQRRAAPAGNRIQGARVSSTANQSPTHGTREREAM